MNWLLKSFQELSRDELYAILRLRSEVFVVEQDCVFLDLDDKDQLCHHLSGWNGDILVAYSRLVPPGLSYTECSIGRVVTSPGERKRGTGKALMQKSIEEVYNIYGPGPIRLGAQHYLKKFYESFGFWQTGPVYLEDGIEHIEMIRLYDHS